MNWVILSNMRFIFDGLTSRRLAIQDWTRWTDVHTRKKRKKRTGPHAKAPSFLGLKTRRTRKTMCWLSIKCHCRSCLFLSSHEIGLVPPRWGWGWWAGVALGYRGCTRLRLASPLPKPYRSYRSSMRMPSKH